MSPLVERGGPRRTDPRREPSDPPLVEFSTEEKSTKAQVAEFRSGRYSVSVPAVVVTALITAVAGAVIAWINKPEVPAPALTAEQAAALQRCSAVAQDVAEIKAWTRWAEPQIGILLVRTDSQRYAPEPRKP